MFDIMKKMNNNQGFFLFANSHQISTLKNDFDLCKKKLLKRKAKIWGKILQITKFL